MPEPGLHCANCRCPLFERPMRDIGSGASYYQAWVWTDQIWDEAICEPHQLSPAGLIPNNHKYHHPTRKDYRPYSKKLRERAIQAILRTNDDQRGFDEFSAMAGLDAMLTEHNDIYEVLKLLGEES